MSKKDLLRISSAIAFLFAVGHTLGGRQYWSPMGDNPVLQMMRAVHFQTMGVSRSYFDFFMGFGYALSVSGVLQACVLWQMGTIAEKDFSLVRPLVLANMVAVAFGGVISWIFIFPIPAAFSIILFVSLGCALVLGQARGGRGL